MSRNPSSGSMRLALALAAVLGLGALGACDKKPSSPPTPKTGSAAIGGMRAWMEPRFHDIQHWNDMRKGAHFAAFEQPQRFVDELRVFFRSHR